MPVTAPEPEVVRVEELKPHPSNPRIGNVDQIAESLTTHGQYRSIVAQRSTGYVLAGNHTWKAACQLGWPTIMVEWVDVDDVQAQRILLVDNRLGDLARYDDAQLLAVLTEIAASGDMSGTGYSSMDVDDLAKLLAGPLSVDDDEVEDDPDLESFWPKLTVSVPPDDYQRWKAHRAAFATDRLAFVALLPSPT